MIEKCNPIVKDLFRLLEDPIEITTFAQSCSDTLGEIVSFEPYMQSIRKNVLLKLLNTLSALHPSMKFETLLEIVKPMNCTQLEIELLIMQSALGIRVNHRTQSFLFVGEAECTSKYASRLEDLVRVLPGSKDRLRAGIDAKEASAEERADLLRQEAAEAQRKRDELSIIKDANVEEEIIHKKSAKEIEAEKTERSLAMIQKAEAKKLRDKVVGDLKAQGMRAQIDLSVLSVPELKLYQDTQEVLIKENIAQKLKTIAKKNDYFVRALRAEEIKRVVIRNEEMRIAALENARLLREQEFKRKVAAYESALEMKTRCTRMVF